MKIINNYKDMIKFEGIAIGEYFQSGTTYFLKTKENLAFDFKTKIEVSFQPYTEVKYLPEPTLIFGDVPNQQPQRNIPHIIDIEEYDDGMITISIDGAEITAINESSDVYAEDIENVIRRLVPQAEINMRIKEESYYI